MCYVKIRFRAHSAVYTGSCNSKAKRTSYAERSVSPQNPREISIETARGLLNCDRGGWFTAGAASDVAQRDKTDDPATRMKPDLETSTQEVLAGLVERVTFHNAENGFCVLRAKARGHRDLVTVVGHAATISAGEWITASGEWINDRAHGQQFKARFLKTSAPSSIDGIEKYLGSGTLRGIGPVYA